MSSPQPGHGMTQLSSDNRAASNSTPCPQCSQWQTTNFGGGGLTATTIGFGLGGGMEGTAGAGGGGTTGGVGNSVTGGVTTGAGAETGNETSATGATGGGGGDSLGMTVAGGGGGGFGMATLISGDSFGSPRFSTGGISTFGATGLGAGGGGTITGFGISATGLVAGITGLGAGGAGLRASSFALSITVGGSVEGRSNIGGAGRDGRATGAGGAGVDFSRPNNFPKKPVFGFPAFAEAAAIAGEDSPRPLVRSTSRMSIEGGSVLGVMGVPGISTEPLAAGGGGACRASRNISTMGLTDAVGGGTVGFTGSISTTSAELFSTGD